MSEPAGEDLARIVDYVDGRLTEEERIALELRFADEPELAEAFEAFERVDRLEKRAAAEPAAVVPLDRWRRAVLAAAALVLFLAAFGVARIWWKPAAPEELLARAAVLPTAATLREYNALLGLEPERLPAGNQTRSGAGEIVPVDVYLGDVRRAEERRATAAATEATAGRFVVPFEVERESSVVVIAVDAAGNAARLFPGDGTAADRFAPDRPHVLPRASVARPAGEPDAERVDFDGGFLVRRGAGELLILLGATEAELGAELLASVDAWRSRLSGDERPDELADGLAGLGFAVVTLTVREP